MRQVIRWLLVSTCVLGGSALAPGEPAPLAPMIVEVDSISSTGGVALAFYKLYIGNAATREMDAVSIEEDGLWLVHPVASVAARMPFAAERGWYLMSTPRSSDEPDGFEPLLRDIAWNRVPVLGRRALFALGIDDAALILVFCHESGSVSIYFHPRYDRDRGFYEKKLSILLRYWRTTDLPKEFPLHALRTISAVPGRTR